MCASIRMECLSCAYSIFPGVEDAKENANFDGGFLKPLGNFFVEVFDSCHYNIQLSCRFLFTLTKFPFPFSGNERSLVKMYSNQKCLHDIHNYIFEF